MALLIAVLGAVCGSALLLLLRRLSPRVQVAVALVSSGLVLVAAIVAFTYDPTVTAMTAARVDGSQVAATYGAVRCTDGFDDYYGAYRGAELTGLSVVNQEQATMCQRARGGLRLFGKVLLIAGLAAPASLALRRSRRQGHYPVAGPDMDETRWAVCTRP